VCKTKAFYHRSEAILHILLYVISRAQRYRRFCPALLQPVHQTLHLFDMKKWLFLLFVLFCFSLSQAATYYFSTSAGDDHRTPTEAQNPATPWKTINRFNAFLRSIGPGDSILFRRGEVFYGTMNVKTRGTPEAPIYYGAWGTGANPVITGFTTVAGWTQQSNGIWWVPLTAPGLNIVTINGEAKGMGRFPNTGFLKYENSNGNTSITDNELTASPNWTGAEIVVRKFRFIQDRHAVTAHNGTTLQYSTSSLYGNNSAFSPVKGNGYFFQNHLQTLDQQGEWYYDSTAKRLYVFFGNGHPDGYVVKASTRDFNAAASTSYFLKFENLDFEGANARGLYLINISNTLVQNCRFYNQGGTALYGIDLNSVTVKDVSINTSFSNGLNFEHNANNCIIENVTINKTNTIAGTGWSGSGIGTGLMASGEHIRIANNRVVNSGYNGIKFMGNHVLVENNYVDSFCLLKDDGGGIYTYTGPSNETGINRVIRNNIILNAIGARAGAEAYYYEPFGKAAGIYLDENANNIEISGNTVANGDWAGIFLHYAHTNNIHDNLFYNHRNAVLVSQFTPTTRNMVMAGNHFIARQPTQNTFYYHTTTQDSPEAIGLLNHNYYARPLDDNNTIQVDNFFTGGNGTSYLSLAQWKAIYRHDTLSLKSPITFATTSSDNFRFEYNATTVAKTVSLDAPNVDVTNKLYTGNLTLAPFSSVLLLKSTALSRSTQTISFGALPNRQQGDPAFALSATSSSGLPVVFRVMEGPAIITNNTVTLTGAGTVTIAALQSGNNSFYAANPVLRSFTVSANTPSAKTAQTISFGSLSFRTWGVPPFALTATASSGLPVSYRVVSGPAVVLNRTVTLIGVGTVVIEATQPGNNMYNAAPSVTRSLTVGKSNQTLTFPAISNRLDTDPPFVLNAVASSGSPVTYRVISGPAMVAGDTVTLTGGAGSVTIEAIQNGNELTNPTYPLQRSFTVTAAGGTTKTSQSISFAPISGKTFGDAPFGLAATASSGLPVSFAMVSGPATVSGNTVTITGAGTVSIQASQAGNTSFHPAVTVTQSFAVAKAAQAISFGPLPDKTVSDAPFALAASATSGLPVAYRVISGPANISGNMVSVTAAGTVTIEASQAGNANYNAATFVAQSFTVRSSGSGVSKQAQSITFGTLGYKTFTSPPFELTASASSGLPVSYRVVSGPVTISGKVVTITGVGSVTIEASQAGNESFTAAAPVQRGFNIGKGAQSLTFPNPPNKIFGDAPFQLTATASSGLPVQYRVVSGPATVSGSTVTLTGPGTVTVEASQAGNANYSAAYYLQRSFTVASSASTLSARKENAGVLQEQGSVTKLMLTVFPNPATDRAAITVQTATAGRGAAGIYDGQGKLVKSLGQRVYEKGITVIEIDVQDLRSGLYFIRLQLGEENSSQPFEVL
jgi:parallel beta-helix repeat protein